VSKNPNILPIANPLAPTISGYTARDLRSAYGLSPANPLAVPNGKTVVIVDAYDDPTAEADLAVYRSRFGLPACTSLTGCFAKVNQAGKAGPYPKYVAGWSDEISLDLAMVSAACPTCKIVLAEANDDNFSSLAQITDVAASYNPGAVSNSYGVPEGPGSFAQPDFKQWDPHYDHPGVPIVASAGDQGHVEFPASSRNVISVAGTTLVRNASTSRGWSETPWPYSGTGCSGYEGQSSWQSSWGCSTRAVADISFDADLNPGIAVYNSNDGGWQVMGGTSAGAPFVAGLFAAAGDYPANAVGAMPLYSKVWTLNPLPGALSLGTPNGLSDF
jgi:subtilase family serine protease